jgi:altronate dehydratase large subunit
VSDSLTGYRRPNGTWGVRNHVLVLPARAAANRAAALIAERSERAVAVAHDRITGRRAGPDDGLIDATLAGFATNPNVGGVLLVAVDDEDNELAATIAAREQRVYVVHMADHGGTLDTVAAAGEVVDELVAATADTPREPMPLGALIVGLECGGSDALSGISANPALGFATDRLIAAGGSAMLAEIPELVGAENLLAARATTPEAARDIVDTIHAFERSVERLGIDIRGAQPTPGNIEGGLTTIEEKSLGAAKKAGSAPITGVLGYAEAPTRPGLYIMDTPGHDIEEMVGQVAGGCQLMAFTTGRGTPTGSPIAPCLKISTTTALFNRMRGDIDLDAGTVVSRGEPLSSVGDRIYDAIISACNGELTGSERRGHGEFALRRLLPLT